MVLQLAHNQSFGVGSTPTPATKKAPNLGGSHYRCSEPGNPAGSWRRIRSLPKPARAGEICRRSSAGLEQLPVEEKVVGSNPIVGAMTRRDFKERAAIPSTTAWAIWSLRDPIVSGRSR